MMAEIADFDETDFKTICATCDGKPFEQLNQAERDKAMDILLAKIGVITGIEIPANNNVFLLLKHEISNSILNTKKYSVLTIKEYEQAFLMMAGGDFGEIKDWGKSLNLKFFFEIINNYCSYRCNVLYNFFNWQFEKKINLIADHNTAPKNNFELTEKAFQEFLSGKYNLLIWYHNCYNDLVYCGWIDTNRYELFRKKAISILTKEKHFEIMFHKKNTIQLNNEYYVTSDDLPINLGKYMEAINGLTSTKNEELKIEIISKQLSMKSYFNYAAINGIKNLFVEDKK